MSAVPTSLDGDGLRSLVRQVLREAMDGAATPPGQVPAGPTPAPPVRVRPAQPGASQILPIEAMAGADEPAETVTLRNDADLATFVLRLLHLFENPKARDDLRSGRRRFRLDQGSLAGSVRPSHRVEKGAVTEAAVKAAAAAGAQLVLGPRAVLTPLARDRARAAGVHIEQERVERERA